MRLLLAFVFLFQSYILVFPQVSNPVSDFPPVPADIMQGELVDSHGKKFRLNDLRGKVVLFNLWGIWCGPCRPDRADLIELQKKHLNDGFEVIGLNVGDHNGKPETVRKIQKFASIAKINYQLVKAVEPDLLVKNFYTLTKQQVVPQSMLIDRDGRLRGVFVGGGPRVFEIRRNILEDILTENDGNKPTHLVITVTDKFGAVISDARVEALSSTGRSFVPAKRSGDGVYNLDLKPGIYAIKITRWPFQTFTIDTYQIGMTKMVLDVSLICADCVEVELKSKRQQLKK